MKLLLDECLPRRLKLHLPGHEVTSVVEAGWQGVKNGALLALAEQSFDVFITMDRNLTFQQRLEGRSIAIVVLRAPDNTLESLFPLAPQKLEACLDLSNGDLLIVSSPKT